MDDDEQLDARLSYVRMLGITAIAYLALRNPQLVHELANRVREQRKAERALRDRYDAYWSGER